MFPESQTSIPNQPPVFKVKRHVPYFCCLECVRTKDAICIHDL